VIALRLYLRCFVVFVLCQLQFGTISSLLSIIVRLLSMLINHSHTKIIQIFFFCVFPVSWTQLSCMQTNQKAFLVSKASKVSATVSQMQLMLSAREIASSLLHGEIALHTVLCAGKQDVTKTCASQRVDCQK
jgi:hypothetical protein